MPTLSPAHIHHELHRHLDQFWPDRDKADFRWTVGRINQTLPEFRVIRISAVPGEAWTYVSSGAWVVRSGHADRFEFVIQSPTQDAIHVETLAMVASFYADPRYNLHLGSVINIGRPWLDTSACDHFLVSHPYPFGPEFENFRQPSITVKILWLCPITADEAQFARERGAEELEQRFERATIDPLDVHRRSVLAAD